VQALAAALQQHTLQPANQPKVTLPQFWSGTYVTCMIVLLILPQYECDLFMNTAS
jgi:hypothetical protein